LRRKRAPRVEESSAQGTAKADFVETISQAGGHKVSGAF